MSSNNRRLRNRGNGRFIKSPETAARRAEVARLYSQEKTFEEIAKILGYYDRHDARKAFLAYMEETAKPTEDARRRALSKLDFAEQAVWDVLERRHITVSNGRVVTHDGSPILDDGPVLQAVGELRQLEALRARYEGTFAPTQSQVQTTVTPAGEEAWQETIRIAHERRAAARAQMENPSDDPAPEQPPAG